MRQGPRLRQRQGRRHDPARGLGPLRRLVRRAHALCPARLPQRRAVRAPDLGHHGNSAVVVAVPRAGTQVITARARTILPGVAVALLVAPARADDPPPATPAAPTTSAAPTRSAAPTPPTAPPDPTTPTAST